MTQTPKPFPSNALPDVPEDELAPGTQLSNGSYTITGHLKSGGFGITYMATDTLGRKVVIKECFPSGLCMRSTRVVKVRSQAHTANVTNLLDKFLTEAHSLAKITHPNVVHVHQVFKENDTAYMVLDFVEGKDLLDTVRNPALAMQPEEIRSILIKLLDAIGAVHEQGILHRDISPDNIVLDAKRNPILIDFGSAREWERQTESAASTLHVVKDGYSPQELYLVGGEQGPFSDLYSLGATFYHLIAGDAPPNSQSRLAAMAANTADPCVPLAGRFPGYDPAFLAAIDKAMSVLPKNRLQSAKHWLSAISEPVDAPASTPQSRVLTRQVTPMTRVTRMEAQAARKNTRPAMMVGGLAALALVATGVFLAMPDNSTATVARVPADAAAAPPKSAAALETKAPTPVAAAPDPAPAPAPAVAVAEPAPVAPAPQEPAIRSEVSALTTNWTIAVPFAAASGKPNAVGTTNGVVPDWLVPGLEILAVNGTPITSLAEISGILRETQVPGDAPAIPAMLTVNGPAGPEDRAIDLPVVHRIMLVSGAEFQSRWVDGIWRTEVVALPDTYAGEMREGDIILGHVSSGVRLESPYALKEALESDIIAGHRSTKLAIQQGGQMWVVTFQLPG